MGAEPRYHACGSVLAAVGLIPQRERATLAAYIDAYIAKRSDVKPLTSVKHPGVPARGVGCPILERIGGLRHITPGDAEDWRLNLLERRLAENTVRKYTAVAKLFFGDAVKKNIIQSNPLGLESNDPAQ